MDASTSSPSRKRKGFDFAQVQRQVLTILGVALFSLLLVGEGSRQGLVDVADTVSPLPGGPWVAILAMIFLMVVSGLFVASEAALTMLRPMHVKHLREKNAKHGAVLEGFLGDQDSAVVASALGSYLARLLLVLPTLVIAPGFAGFASRWLPIDPTNYLAVVLAGFLLLIFPIGPLTLIVEQGLRSYGLAHPHGATYRLRGLIRLSMVAFALPVRLTAAFAKLVSVRVAQVTPPMTNAAEEEIRTLVDSAEESGEFEEEESDLIHSVFEFSDTIAREVMTPRVDLDAMDIDSDPAEILQLIKESGHSRIPLFEGTDDQIVGIVHAKDLLMAMLGDAPVVLRDLMFPPMFVPESKELHELLTEMRQGRSQLAIVQDEFGGTAGIVTIEDIVEELVGEIVDEYDHEEPVLMDTGEGWSVDGRMNLDDLNHEIESTFESEQFDTVGGFVFGHFGRQPKESESVLVDGYRFTVMQTDGRRVERLRIEKLEEAEATADLS